MATLPAVLRSTVGQKIIMAVTGLILIGFVIGHMTGNLKIFAGPESLNGYAEFLREVGYPILGHGMALWIARIGLLVAVVLHVTSAVTLTRRARAARAVDYQRPVHLEDTYASRTMRWGGAIIFVYVIYHLLHMTTGSAHPDFIAGDVYHNMVTAFQSPVLAIVYAVANIMLCFHLYHGIWSMTQTLGLNHPEIERFRRPVAAVVSIGLLLGFLAPPFAVLFGVVS